MNDICSIDGPAMVRSSAPSGAGPWFYSLSTGSAALHPWLQPPAPSGPNCPDNSAGAETTHARTAIQRKMDSTDQRINQLVYEVYGLTDGEIRMVEEATAG